ncbi:PH domain-containing protein [Streptomyces sp. TP-A0356]|uniref:PH domain-containing protein n=1 Tax=Streptomyces sp. TP-A0356 TaxID=1359208 RepID=UPI0006E3479D
MSAPEAEAGIPEVRKGRQVAERRLHPLTQLPLWWRGHGLAVTDTVFAARHGLLRRSLALVPHAKVQSVRLTQGPWRRFKEVADVQVDTGANRTVRARLRDAEEATALLYAQADRSRTGRRDARPERWMVP